MTRLASLAPLQESDEAALQRAMRAGKVFAAGREIVAEGMPVITLSFIMSGWALMARDFRDGRLQILGLLLPGELIGHCRQRNPVAATSIRCATPLTLCHAPSLADHPTLDVMRRRWPTTRRLPKPTPSARPWRNFTWRSPD
jgi:CRP-like cAMP-binding protein